MWKRFLQIGTGMLVAGLALLAIGSLNHGFQPVAIVSGRPMVSRVTTKTTNLAPFTTITAKADDLDVVVKNGPHYQVKVTMLTGTGITSRVHAGMLTMTQTGGADLGMLLGHTPTPRITITVPKNKKIQTVKIRTKDGALRYTIPQTGQLRLASASGDITVSGAQVGQTEIRTVSGDIRLTKTQLHQPQITTQDGTITVTQGTIRDGQFQLSSDDFTLRNSKLLGTTRVRNRDGENRVIGADAARGYRLQTRYGENTLFNRTTEKQVATHNWSAANRIELVTQSGDNRVTAR
ncbi:MAG: DUF4097 domain-containing protein [Schleiferilactobacillus harbinensis]|jgi:hypothetical protein|nr:DUF4097 domain-containing protein [Schleiferilactobacillus harbinensis]MCI1912095.1 DUF4097 domain-containing protein [Schleiferilactobacillus harbinensis]